MTVKPIHKTLLFMGRKILFPFSLLMSAFSPQLCLNNETLFFNHFLSVPLPYPKGGQKIGILFRPDIL